MPRLSPVGPRARDVEQNGGWRVTTVAVIGVGRLGSRHVEGLARLESVRRLIGVEPSVNARADARERLSDVRIATGDPIELVGDVSDLPDRLDYVVVATSSDVRRAVIEELLDGREVGHLLLEKVLFQRLADFDVVDRLLQERGVSARVDTARRAFPIYQEVRDHFADDPVVHMDVRGGDWGLACNGIHFLDLLCFLTGALPETIETAQLARAPIPSKRPGFYEFQGTLTGRVGQAQFSVAAAHGSSMPPLVVLRSETKSCIVDDVAGAALFREGAQAWRQVDFTVPFISDLTTMFAREALAGRDNGLPTYVESAACHRPFIAAIAGHAGQTLDLEPGFCPIT